MLGKRQENVEMQKYIEICRNYENIQKCMETYIEHMKVYRTTCGKTDK